MKSVISILFLLLVLSSCGTREARIDRKTRNAIDTIAAREIIALRPVLDSLCELRKDSILEVAVDSIVKRRELEVQKIVGQ